MSKLNSDGLAIRPVKSILSQETLTLILLTWRIGRAPNNASKWQMGFNLAFKGLRMLFLSYIHSLITYGVIFGGNLPFSIKIFIVQKKTIRIVPNSVSTDS